MTFIEEFKIITTNGIFTLIGVILGGSIPIIKPFQVMSLVCLIFSIGTSNRPLRE